MQEKDRDRDLAAVRRLLSAAASDDTPAEAPPFFAARVRAQAIARAGAASPHPVGVAAWRLLPLFGAVAIAVATFSGFESWRFARDREAAMARVLTADSRGDMFVAALLFATEADDTTGGAP